MRKEYLNTVKHQRTKRKIWIEELTHSFIYVIVRQQV